MSKDAKMARMPSRFSQAEIFRKFVELKVFEPSVCEDFYNDATAILFGEGKPKIFASEGYKVKSDKKARFVQFMRSFDIGGEEVEEVVLVQFKFGGHHVRELPGCESIKRKVVCQLDCGDQILEERYEGDYRMPEMRHISEMLNDTSTKTDRRIDDYFGFEDVDPANLTRGKKPKPVLLRQEVRFTESLVHGTYDVYKTRVTLPKVGDVSEAAFCEVERRDKKDAGLDDKEKRTWTYRFNGERFEKFDTTDGRTVTAHDFAISFSGRAEKVDRKYFHSGVGTSFVF